MVINPCILSCYNTERYKEQGTGPDCENYCLHYISEVTQFDWRRWRWRQICKYVAVLHPSCQILSGCRAEWRHHVAMYPPLLNRSESSCYLSQLNDVQKKSHFLSCSLTEKHNISFSCAVGSKEVRLCQASCWLHFSRIPPVPFTEESRIYSIWMIWSRVMLPLGNNLWL